MAIVFTGFVCCDLLLLEWEYIPSKFLYYIVHSGICLYLIFLTFKHLHYKKIPQISNGESLALLFFYIINSVILIRLGSWFSEIIVDPLLTTLFYINGFIIITLVIAAFFYSTNLESRFSAFYFISVLGLTISELVVFSIYFLEVPEFRYIDNLFYILGLYWLVKAFQFHSNLLKKKYDPLITEQEVNKMEKELQIGTYR